MVPWSDGQSLSKQLVSADVCQRQGQFSALIPHTCVLILTGFLSSDEKVSKIARH